MKIAGSIFFLCLTVAMFFSAPDILYAVDEDSLTVTDTGNVGIGITSPQTKLHINGSVRGNQSGALRIDTGYGYLDIGPRSNTWAHFSTDRSRFYFNKEIRVDSGNIGSYNEDLSLNTSGIPRITVLNSNGHTGFGTTTPGAQVDINASSTTAGGWYEAIRFSNTAHSAITHPAGGLLFGMHGNQRKFYFADINDGSFQKYLMSINAINGYVGIGTTAPQQKLHVAGCVLADNVQCSSDVRWKENIEPIYDGLERVAQLRGVSYEWIDKSRGEGPQFGLIAQEVEEVFPEVVHTDSQGYKSIEYSKLVAPLIEAVKTLKSENNSLRVENKYLQERDHELKTRLLAIESQLADIQKKAK